MKKYITTLGILSIVFFLSSCEKFVTLASPDGSVDNQDVYNSDATATAGIVNLYSNGGNRDAMLNTSLLSGMAADVLNFSLAQDWILQFQNNSIDPNNNTNANMIWFYTYQQIRAANIAIEDLQKTSNVNTDLKNQLLGEAKFWRGYSFFVLLNFYEGVPLTLSATALDNAEIGRSSLEEVWEQVFQDLTDAKKLVGASYPSNDRARVNKSAVSALLARAYLYKRDWVNAERESTEVISSGTYSLSSTEGTFKRTSAETILQIFTINGFTQWGVNYVPATSTSGKPNYYLRPGFIDNFEANDARKEDWVAAIGDGDYYIRKYRVRAGNAGDEYYIMFRLAEMYLIRAEARANQDKVTGANGGLEDLNMVRDRANIGALNNLDKAGLLLAVENERKLELFGEWAHRWFDLKRNPSISQAGLSRADDVLSVVKGDNWQSTDVLFPIPASQRELNPALTQNDGYN